MPFTLLNGVFVDPKPPFFIVGSGRSGTTLMRRLLIEGTGVVIPPENYSIGTSGRLVELAKTKWPACVQQIVRNLSNDERHWKTFGLDKGALRDALAEIGEEDRTIPNFWHAFHAIYAARAGKPSVAQWGDKTPINAFRLDALNKLFPAAKYVVMVRDVFDVAYSYGSMEILGRNGRYIDGARRWKSAYAHILDFSERHAGQLMFVRYERLVKGPEVTMRRVASFLDLRIGKRVPLADVEARDLRAWPHLEAAMNEVRADSVGTGRTKLPVDVKTRIATMASHLQVHFGYEPGGNPDRRRVRNARGRRRS